MFTLHCLHYVNKSRFLMNPVGSSANTSLLSSIFETTKSCSFFNSLIKGNKLKARDIASYNSFVFDMSRNQGNTIYYMVLFKLRVTACFVL